MHTWRPFTHHSSAEPDYQGQAIEEHVYAVADQAKRSGGDTIERLDQHERKVKSRKPISNNTTVS